MLYAVGPVHHGIDQKPASLSPPSECLPEGITEERSSEETAQLPTPPIEKRRWVRCSKRPVFKRRRRVACLIFVLLLLLTVGGLLFLKNAKWTDSEPLEPVVSPTISQAPEVVGE